MNVNEHTDANEHSSECLQEIDSEHPINNSSLLSISDKPSTPNTEPDVSWNRDTGIFSFYFFFYLLFFFFLRKTYENS